MVVDIFSFQVLSHMESSLIAHRIRLALEL